MVEFSRIYQDKLPHLPLQAREKARAVSTQIWGQSMKLLQGKGVHIMNEFGPICKEIVIWEEKRPRDNEQDVDLIIMVNTFLSDQTRSRISTIEVFNFHKDEGGYVVKEYWPTFPKDKDHEVHEANKDELEELLKIIEQGEEK